MSMSKEDKIGSRPLNMKHFKRILVATLMVIIAVTAWQYIKVNNNETRLQTELQIKQVQIQDKIIELEKTKQNTEQLQKELEQTKKDLQSKREKQEADRVYAESIVEPVRIAFGGDCATWVSQAGIADVASANALIAKESGCNPNAINPSSGACGVAQELPCGKSGCQLGDGACQVKWMDSYIAQRYGSWANALAFHKSHNWY